MYLFNIENRFKYIFYKWVTLPDIMAKYLGTLINYYDYSRMWTLNEFTIWQCVKKGRLPVGMAQYADPDQMIPVFTVHSDSSYHSVF